MSGGKFSKRLSMLEDESFKGDFKRACLVKDFVAKSKELAKNNKTTEAPRAVGVSSKSKKVASDDKDKLLDKLRQDLKRYRNEVKEANSKLKITEKALIENKQDNERLLQELSEKDMKLKDVKLLYNNTVEELNEQKKLIRKCTIKRDKLKTAFNRKDKLIRDLFVKCNSLNQRLENSLKEKLVRDKEFTRQYESGLNNKITELTEKLNKSESECQKKLEDIESYYKRLLKEKNNELILATTPSKTEVVDTNQLGYLQTIDGVQYFVDLEGNMKTIKPHKDGLPCKAKVLDDNYVYLSRVYTDCMLDSVEHSITGKSKLILKTKPEKERLIFDRKYSVLIITSERIRLYKSELEKSNLKVDFFNSFDESESRLNSIEGAYDIVICCKDHAKHWAYYYTQERKEENSYKYHIISKDTVSRILSRINYGVCNLDIQ